jgi:myo-inositol-1(or 4)-monophosphatase
MQFDRPMTSPEDDPRLHLARDLARQGGRLALISRDRMLVGWKGPGDRVTDVDVAVQRALVEGIRRRFPADGVVGEEVALAEVDDREFVWVVDPLDGTNNYALGIPCFAVSVGILRDGRPYAGVVHDPNTGLTCWAARKGGAFRDGRALAVEPRSLTEASNIAVRAPLDPELEPVLVGWLERHKLRGFGSVALHLALAATGSLDLVQDHRATLWDIAAGAVILEEAGGVITDPAGHELFPPDDSAYRGRAMPFLAGNPAAHSEAVARCRAPRRRDGDRA